MKIVFSRQLWGLSQWVLSCYVCFKRGFVKHLAQGRPAGHFCLMHLWCCCCDIVLYTVIWVYENLEWKWNLIFFKVLCKRHLDFDFCCCLRFFRYQRWWPAGPSAVHRTDVSRCSSKKKASLYSQTGMSITLLDIFLFYLTCRCLIWIVLETLTQCSDLKCVPYILSFVMPSVLPFLFNW